MSQINTTFDPALVSSMLREAQHHAKQSAILRDKAHEHVEKWAKSSCLSLCTEMQSRLPRELRDMVYASVFQDSDSFVVSHDILPGVLESYHHLCDTTFVGQETLVELAEEWHHYCIFHLNLNSNGQGLYDTGKDIWDLPNLDFVRHIRHIQVEICPPYVKQDEGSIDLEGMPEGWQYLYKLQRPATLALKVDYEEWMEAYRPQDLHDDFVELLTYLIGAGVKVTLELANSYRSKSYSGSIGLEHLENDMWCALLYRVWWD